MTLAGTNLEYAKSFNRRVVLETVRLHGRLSRAEIARLTGLSAQTVSNIAEELTRADLLREEGRRSGRRGQPAVELAINPDGGFTFGLYLDHRRLVALLVNMEGNLCGQVDRAVDHPSPETALPLIEAALGDLAARAAVAPERIWGAGLVMPGLFEEGSLVSFGPTSLPGWDGYPLVERLGARLGMPVLVENDATAAAVGELLYGAGRTLRDFFYIFFGVGLGGGMIMNGQPYRGARGKAGEFGHVVVAANGIPCPCGNRGCLERYVSLQAACEAAAGMPLAPDAIGPETLAERLAAGDERLLAWLDSAAGHLRVAISMIENLLDPQTIVLGGVLPEPLLDRLIAALDPLLPSISVRGDRPVPRILKAERGLETPALGAAALPLFDSVAPSFTLLHKRAERSPGNPLAR